MSSVLQHPSRDLGLIIYLKNVGTSSYLGTYSKIIREDPCVASILWISFPMFLQNKLSFVFAINFYTEIKEENSLSLCFLIIFVHNATKKLSFNIILCSIMLEKDVLKLLTRPNPSPLWPKLM